MGSGRKGVADLRFLSSPSPSLTTLEGPKLKARELHSRPGTRDSRPWTRYPHSGPRPPHSGARPPHSGTRHPHSGNGPSYSGTRPSHSGTRTPHSGTRHPHSGTRHSHSGTRHPHSGTRVSGVSFKSASLFPLKNAELRLCQKNSAFLKPNFAFSISVPFLQTRPKLVRKHLRGYPCNRRYASQNP